MQRFLVFLNLILSLGNSQDLSFWTPAPSVPTPEAAFSSFRHLGWRPPPSIINQATLLASWGILVSLGTRIYWTSAPGMLHPPLPLPGLCAWHPITAHVSPAFSPPSHRLSCFPSPLSFSISAFWSLCTAVTKFPLSHFFPSSFLKTLKYVHIP